MRFMNDIDIYMATRRFDAYRSPNRARVALVIARLSDWANDNSDGWAHWPKPARSAAKAMDLVDGTTNADIARLEGTDATADEVKRALAPIKSFLTRHGVSADERDHILG